jgi:phosphoribosylformylglycinamidine synthase
VNKKKKYRYSSVNGDISIDLNPNGSKMNINGILNKNGNVLGILPTLERYIDIVLCKTNGIEIFDLIS